MQLLWRSVTAVLGVQTDISHILKNIKTRSMFEWRLLKLCRIKQDHFILCLVWKSQKTNPQPAQIFLVRYNDVHNTHTHSPL